jgi:hypothetical protein
MNDIHGFGIFDAANYKARVLGGDFPAFRGNDKFFMQVTNNTKAFTQSLLAEISARHTFYNGGEKIMSEIPLPPGINLQPLQSNGKVVDWIITNSEKGVAVSQGLLNHCFGPSFNFHIDRRNFKNEDGTITTVPIMMVTGSTRRFYNTCERFANYMCGRGDNYGKKSDLKQPQMQYPLIDYYEQPVRKKSSLNLDMQIRAKGGYKQLGGHYL